MKTARQLERYSKGIANHWRIEILFLLSKKKELSLDEIREHLGCHVATVSEHTRRLVQAGLINKQYLGRTVAHSLSPYGKLFVDFLKKF